jgi:small conductance mechanosensitive channel
MGRDELDLVTDLYSMFVTYMVTYSFQIFGAIVVLVIGIFVGRWVSNLVLTLCGKKLLDIPSVDSFPATSA